MHTVLTNVTATLPCIIQLLLLINILKINMPFCECVSPLLNKLY